MGPVRQDQLFPDALTPGADGPSGPVQEAQVLTPTRGEPAHSQSQGPEVRADQSGQRGSGWTTNHTFGSFPCIHLRCKPWSLTPYKDSYIYMLGQRCRGRGMNNNKTDNRLQWARTRRHSSRADRTAADLKASASPIIRAT